MASARSLIVLLALSVSAGCGSSPIAPTEVAAAAIGNSSSGTAPSEVASDIVRFTNDARAAAGITALQPRSALTQAAMWQAGQMAAAGQMAHTLPGAPYPMLEDRLSAAGYQWQTAGENIAAGQTSAAQAMNGWLQSTGHRANILNTSFTEIGAGVASDTTGTMYYVQVFGRPR